MTYTAAVTTAHGITDLDVAIAILADVNHDQRTGAVPADVDSFSALHDHTDANVYVIDACERLGADPMDLDLANAATDLVDAVLKDRLTRTKVTHYPPIPETDKTLTEEVLRSIPVVQPATLPTPVATVEEKDARDAHDVDSVTVRVEWVGGDHVDRRDGYSISTGRRQTPRQAKASHALAARLKRAIDAGAVFYEVKVARDINGATFLTYRSRVMGKYLNADLKRIGY